MDDGIVSRMVQIGIVTDVNADAKKARVYFDDSGMTSDWLSVLQQFGSESQMPKINDVVVVVYLPIFNADGFIIGGLYNG